MSRIIAIYDGDILAFRASAAIEKRTVKVTHISSNKSKVFDTRTQFKDFLKDKGKDYIKEDYTFEDLQEAEPIANCLSILKNQIERINSDLFVDEYIIGVGGKDNFRDSLPLPKKYKGNREGGLKPVHLDAAKKYLIKYHNAVVVNKHEVDDFLIYKGYEYLAKGYTPIIVGIDKDSYSASGLSLYDFTKDVPEVELIPSFGSLWDTGDKITGRGFIWLCQQLLNGDSTDNFKPSELAKVKFGEKSAYKLLKDTTTQQEALSVVLEQYKKWYPEPVTYLDYSGVEHTKDYLEIFDLYYRCARMMQHENDTLDSKEFIDKYTKEV